MLILPKDNQEKAKRLLDQAMSDRYTITMLVFGDGSDQDQIASKADVRAGALSSTRRVVWIRDVDILTDDQKQIYKIETEDVVACALNLDDKPVAFLTKQQGLSLLELERAFLKAQQG